MNKYDFLDRTVIVIHQEEEREVSHGALAELKQYARTEFYDRDRMVKISRERGVQAEVNKLVKSILAERALHPDASNTECIAMDMFTEFLSKLNMDDFRQIRIERLIEVFRR